MTDSEYESQRTDWRSLFVYDPTTGRTELIGGATLEDVERRLVNYQSTLTAQRSVTIDKSGDPSAINPTLAERMNSGIDHDSRSADLYKFIAELDFTECSDSFGFKHGGDGDNGEILMFLMDCYFASKDVELTPDQRSGGCHV